MTKFFFVVKTLGINGLINVHNSFLWQPPNKRCSGLWKSARLHSPISLAAELGVRHQASLVESKMTLVMKKEATTAYLF